MVKMWKIESETELLKTRPFAVIRRIFDKPDGRGKMEGHVLRIPNWVNIMPVTPDKRIILIRQYRFGTNQIELEFPGGTVDEGEEPLHAAARELEEETGFKPISIRQLGVVNSNPAIQTNKCYSFYAEVNTKGSQHLDEDEIIDCEYASFDELVQYIKAGDITNPYVIMTFFWYLTEKGLKF
jgi:8-oxo-dGTP pyrophosphatase MutT (NUDIX family)